MRWTDDHCHLPRAPEHAAPVVEEAAAEGVERLITVGCDPVQSADYVRLAALHPGRVWATVGIHPHDARLWGGADGLDAIEAFLGEPGVVAVGECGLDYHYDHSPRDTQRAIFAAQVALARAHATTLVIHTREAWDDTFDVLAAEGTPERVVFHCFSGGVDEARRCLDLGAYLSFSGIVSFPAADDVRAAATLCPVDRLLVETDSPYLAPVPHRGKKNRPALVTVVGAAVAAARAESPEAVAAATWANAERVYDLTLR